MANRVGIGLVGAGAFGEFCLQAFADMTEVKVVAVCDVDAERATRFASQYGAQAYTDLADMLKNDAVEIVALNTPPFLHATQGEAILRAKKHLFCEKPLALTYSDGQALVALAHEMGVLLTVNYVMRRNPLWELVATIRAQKVLGRLLHVDLANHAAGLNLPPHHWFWDKTKSGGIWIEHGVHFFDALAWVCGDDGLILSAYSMPDDAGHETRVEALARYGDTLAHFYHGFTHNSQTERTTVNLAFEHGFITLHEWVATQAVCVLDIPLDSITRLLPPSLSVTNQVGHQIVIQHQGDKSEVYRLCIQAGIRELAQSIRGDNKMLSVTGDHALSSLKMAADAERV